MFTRLPGLLTADDVRLCRQTLEGRAWGDGTATAGAQSALAKHNLQLDETRPETAALRALVLARLGQSAHFVSAALPARIFPPLFNRYDAGMGFADHIDNAMRYAESGRYRTDLSCTIFLSDLADYEGGELTIEQGGASTRLKLPAGDAVLYPAGTTHRVEEVRRGARLACIFWIQSMIRDGSRRELLREMDEAIALTRRDLGDGHAAAIALTGAYHNLIRMWAEA